MRYRQCPKCGGTNVHRSRRKGFYERVLLRLRGLRPYRCVGCNHRYFDAVTAIRRRHDPEQ
jgi:hypothetical protein